MASTLTQRHVPVPAHKLAPVAIPSSTLDTATKKDGHPVLRGPVTASLTYYSPPADGAKPFNYVESPPPGVPQRNFGAEYHEIQINDIRGRENAFSLDNNAFEAISNVPSKETEFNDEEHIKSVYYPEVEKLLLENVPGANRVILFDHTIRRGSPNAHRAPVTRVHIDQTASSSAERVRLHAPEDAEQLLQGRYRIINVWRPLNGPVISHPLAVADSATVADEDLIPVEHRYPNRTGETAGVKHNDGQVWYYWSGMKNDEVLFLKCFDSDEVVGRNGRVPHTAFKDGRAGPDAPQRESIEVRALVFG